MRMKKLLTFLTLLTLSIGVSWAAETVTINATSGNGGFFRWSSAKNTGSSDPAIVSDYLRLYAGNTLSFYIANNNPKKFKSIKFTDTGQKTHNWASLTANNGTFNSDTKTWTAADETTTSVTFTNTNSGGGYLQIKVVEVTYVGDGGDTPEPTTYALTLPTGLTGGTVTATGYSDLTAIPAGTNMTVTATPATGYTLEWMKANGVEVQSPYEFAINAATAITASFTEQSTPQPSGSNKFERINNVNKLEVGARYLLVYETKPAVMGGIEGSGNTIHGASIESGFTIANGVLTLNANSDAKPLTLGGSSGAWTFDLDGTLLSHTSGNSLTTGTSNTTWTIAFSGNNATITNATNTTRVIKYNTGSPRFACYESGQQPIQLYKEVTEEVQVADLYLIGCDMNSQSDWNISTGPKFTYNSSTKRYAVDAYFDMADRGYFQFVDGLSDENSNWDGLTGRYYASGNSDVAVDNYPMDGTVPLYFTNSTEYSSGKYAFTVPAGMYTIVADKKNWQIYVTQKPVTMTINGTTYFDENSTATLSSNLTELGGKIYYTLDGSDPTASSTLYSEPIPITATTTVKAIAILNHIKSAIADKTFTKTPKAPVITPNGGSIHEATQVTITCETEGASIYYTLDESTPTNVVSETNFLYSEPFTISKTTTVKARAYVGDTYSSITTAKFTYSEPIIPGTGDFQLVTKASQLVAGNELIIVTTFEGLDDELETVTYNYAMGAINSSNKGSHTTDFTFQGVIGIANSAITAGSGVNILKLGGSDGAFTLQQESDEKFLSMTKSNTNISASYSGSPLLITVDDSDYRAYVGNNADDNDRQILYSIENNNNVFGNYKSSNIGNNYKEIYLYYREAPATPKTLAEIVALGAAADGKKYTISDANGLLGVYKKDNTVTVWFKDDNQAIDKQTTGPGTQNFEIEDENGNTKNSEDFDQSNWIEVDFSNVDVPESVTGNEPNVYIQNLTGTYSYNGGNPKLVLTKTPAAADVTAVPNTNPNDAYVPNPYIPAHFGTNNGGYFFSKPKAQEYAYITLAAWDGKKMNVPSLMTTQYGFTGSFSIIADQATLNALKIYDPNAENEKERGLTYSFHAIICKAGSASPAPRLKVEGEEYEIRPTDLTASSVPTAISTVGVSGDVKSVKYVNVAGVVSDRPFQGVNIVVTEYTDGSRTTAKMVR